MEIMETERKGKHLNTLERYHIYKASKDKIQMNDTNIDIYNPIFKAVTHTFPHIPPHYHPHPNHYQNTINTTQHHTRHI
jgi:hypothetical protein